jgi:hypothetical protein
VTGTEASGDVQMTAPAVMIKASTKYSARVSAWTVDRKVGLKIHIEWWNAGGKISTSSSTVTSGFGYGMSWVTATSPSNATLAIVRISDEGTGTGSSAFDGYIDGAMLVEGDNPTGYYDTPPANLLAGDSSFESGIGSWTGSTAPGHAFTAPACGWASHGGYSAHLTGNVANGVLSAYSPWVTVTPNAAYTARIDTNVISTVSGLRVEIEFSTGSGDAGQAVNPTRSGTGLSTLTVTGTAPSNATRARIRISDETHNGTTGPVDAYLDGAMFVEGSLPTRDFGPATIEQYPTSTRYGGDNCSVDTNDEITAVRTALGQSGYLHGPVWDGLKPENQPRIYPTSWTYGGANRSVDEASEIDAVISAAAGAATDAEAAAMRDGLAPADVPRVLSAPLTLEGGSNPATGPISEPNSAERAELGSDPADDADATASAAAGYPKRACRNTHDVRLFKMGIVIKSTVGTLIMNGRYCWDAYKRTAIQSVPPTIQKPVTLTRAAVLGNYSVDVGDALPPRKVQCLGSYPNRCNDFVDSWTSYGGLPATQHAVAMGVAFDVKGGCIAGYCVAYTPEVDVTIARDDGNAQAYFFDRKANGTYDPQN